MFAAIFFVFDHLIGHAIFGLIMPHLMSNVGYNISQSHQGQIFCVVIVWPLIAYLFILEKKKHAYWLMFATGLIAFVPFIMHGLNYNAALSFLVGLFVFVFFIIYRKNLTMFSIVAFLLLLLIVPVLFIIFEQEQLSLLPTFKDSISHRFCIWHYYAQKIEGSFLFGYGFNVSEKFGIIENVSCNMIYSFRHLHEGLVANGHHPHNIGLQSVLELGLVGLTINIIIGIIIILQTDTKSSLIIRKNTVAMLNRQNTIRSGLLASFFALFVFLIAAVNIWSAWVLATILYILFVSKMLIMASKDIK
jgi:O-antigen ligase